MIRSRLACIGPTALHTPLLSLLTLLTPCMLPCLRPPYTTVLKSKGTFHWKTLAAETHLAYKNSRKASRAAQRATENQVIEDLEEPSVDAAAKVRIASAGPTKPSSVGNTASSKVQTASVSSYTKDPGMYDPEALLPVAPEISGALGVWGLGTEPRMQGVGL